MVDDKDAAERLRCDGWTPLESIRSGLSPREERSLGELIAETRRSPPDPYCQDKTRFRTYQRGSVIQGVFRCERPLVDDLLETESIIFDRKGGKAGDNVRTLSTIPFRVWHNLLFRSLQRHAFETALPALGRDPNGTFEWEAHVVRTVGDTCEAFTATDPFSIGDGLTQRWTFIYVLEREGVVGGVNLIAQRPTLRRQSSAVPATDILYGVVEEPLDGYAFDSSKVAPHLTGVEVAPGYARGARTHLAFSFTRVTSRPTSI